MRNHDTRVLREFGINKAEWAVLFAASYYDAIPLRRFIELAAWESDGEVTEDQVADALEQCVAKNWAQVSAEEPTIWGSGEPEETVLLTDLGYQLKNSAVVAIMETVPLTSE